MYVLAGMLLLGLLCNLLIRPVDPRYHMTEEQLAKERATSPSRSSAPSATPPEPAPAARNYTALLVIAWTAVAVPLAWGGWITLSKALSFFR